MGNCEERVGRSVEHTVGTPPPFIKSVNVTGRLV